MAVVQQPVQNGGRHDLVAQHRSSVPHGAVGRDQNAASLIAAADELEQGGPVANEPELHFRMALAVASLWDGESALYSAIEGKDRGGDKSRIVARQIGNRAREFVQRAKPAEWHQRKAAFGLLGSDPVEHHP